MSIKWSYGSNTYGYDEQINSTKEHRPTKPGAITGMRFIYIDQHETTEQAHIY